MFTSLESGMQHFKTVCCIDKEVNLLKLTIKPGEFIDIGKDIRVVYSGGSNGNIHLLIDAPRELNIVRSKVLAKNSAANDGENSRFISPYYAESNLSPETLTKSAVLSKRIKTTATDNIRCWHGNTVYYISATSFA